MRKVSKALAVVLSVCLLFSVAVMVSADPMPNPNYKRPDGTITKITTDIMLDGVLESAWKEEATEITFTRAALEAGSGLVWTHTTDGGLTWEPMTEDGQGTAYIGWNEDYILFALQVKDATNTNSQIINSELWKGDCLQLQVGADATLFEGEDVTATGVERYELGFALSSSTRRGLGYQWRPLEKDLPNARAQKVSQITGDVGYYVSASGGTTTYEVAIKTTAFGRTEKLAEGSVIPFSFSLHMYKDNPVDDIDGGWFLEWARGVVGGDTPNIAADDPYLGIKNIGSAARLTLIEKEGEVVTTRPPVVTTTATKKDDTTTTTKNDDGNNNNNNNTTSGDGDVVITTPAPTTTTTAPEIEGVDVYYNDDDATDVDDETIISAIQAQMETDEVTIPEGNEMVIKAYAPGAAKFAIPMGDVAAIYAKDGESYTQLTGEAIKDDAGNDTDWYTFDVSELEEGATVYVVKSYVPTTTPAPTTATQADSTTAGTTRAATTTAAGDGEEGGSTWWIWLIVAIVVVAAAGVVVFFVLKKKNADGDLPEDGGDDTDTPSEE